jgi:hypothetical protein
MRYALSIVVLLVVSASGQAPAPARSATQSPKTAAFNVFEASIPEMQAAMKAG